MDTALFRQQREAMKQRLALNIGCSPGDFDRERLVIVDRPEGQWYAAGVVTFGVGTVASVAPRYRPFVDANAPAPHFRALYPVLLQRMVTEFSTEAEPLAYRTGDMYWAISTLSTVASPPPGFELESADPAWMFAEMGSGRWDNALGEQGEDREQRNLFACVVRASNGDIAAIAGVYLTYGMHEIGVDVARDYRGNGLGKLVVGAAAQEIIRRRETALYRCASSNIRSQRTALACGLLPAASTAWVAPLRD